MSNTTDTHENTAWLVHVYGPDDVYEYADEVEALREANALNRVILQNHEKHANDPNWPYAVAVVERNTFATRELTPEKGPAADPAQMTGTGKAQAQINTMPSRGERPGA